MALLRTLVAHFNNQYSWSSVKKEVKAQKKWEAGLLFCRNLHSSQRGMIRSHERAKCGWGRMLKCWSRGQTFRAPWDQRERGRSEMSLGRTGTWILRRGWDWGEESGEHPRSDWGSWSKLRNLGVTQVCGDKNSRLGNDELTYETWMLSARVSHLQHGKRLSLWIKDSDLYNTYWVTTKCLELCQPLYI